MLGAISIDSILVNPREERVLSVPMSRQAFCMGAHVLNANGCLGR